MAHRRYRGAITTVREACDADKVVLVRCTRCRNTTQMHAFRLVLKMKATDLLLNEPQPGFRCMQCRRSVEVVISCPEQY